VESIARTIFLVVAAILVIGLFVQVFLAGLGVFSDYSDFFTHRDMGYTLSLLPVVLIVAGLLGRMGRRLVLLSLLLGLLFLLQSVFVGIRSDQPGLAALHPVNGFLILLLAIFILREAWVQRRVAVAVSAGEASSDGI